jgi:hypothetical protein
MMAPDLFMVWIYRREDTQLIGMIQSARDGRRQPFRDSIQLWCALSDAIGDRPADQCMSHGEDDDESD